jgi:DNA polymerase III alpha subunit (gram-positive type)
MFDYKYKKILIFDLETTGLNFENDRIIEFAGILLELQDNKYIFTKEVNKLISIDFNLPQKIIELTNINDEMLKNEGIEESELFSLLDPLINSNTLLVAYNIQFDLSFLSMFMQKYKGKQYLIKNDILDVFAIYKDRYDYPHKLKDAINTYKIDAVNSHRAIDDVKATYKILQAMINENNNIASYINVIGFNPKYRLSGIRLPHVKYYPHYFKKSDLLNKIQHKF